MTLKIAFATLYDLILCNMFFDRQNQWSGLTKSDITFVLFEIVFEIWQLYVNIHL